MEKQSFYGVLWHELESVCGYLKNLGYVLEDNVDTSISVKNRGGEPVGTIHKIGALVFSGLPEIYVENSDLEKVLDQYISAQEGS